MTIFAFIPFRYGSSRLKNKNIRFIKNRPLVYWTVLIAIKTKEIDKVILSTDSKKYLSILINFLKKDQISLQKLIIDKREKKYSNSKYKIFDYVKNFLVKKFTFKKNDLIVQLLPTLPLRNKLFISKCIKFSLKRKKNIFSANEFFFHISFAFKLNKKKLWKNIFNNSPMITGKTRGQDQIKSYHPNGLINCVFYKNLIKKKTKTYYTDALPIISPKYMSLDIDNHEDFEFLKKITENKL